MVIVLDMLSVDFRPIDIGFHYDLSPLKMSYPIVSGNKGCFCEFAGKISSCFFNKLPFRFDILRLFEKFWLASFQGFFLKNIF